MTTTAVVGELTSSWQPVWPKGPAIYQLNVRVLLTELSSSTHRTVTLANIPDSHLASLAQKGFDFVYLLGVWSTGQAGLTAAQRFMCEHFPHVPQEQVCSSPFAVLNYEVDPEFGGNSGLADFREKLRKHKLGLILDFVPNHVAFDHEWANTDAVTNPGESLIMPGNLDLLRREPQNYFLVVQENDGSNKKVFQGDDGLRYLNSNHGVEHQKRVAILAHGRDPHFDGWRDTAQLNYFSHKLRANIVALLKQVSGMCDGIRCDMANLIANPILDKTWGSRYREAVPNANLQQKEFWEEAIRSVKAVTGQFKFIAEVYWDMEGELMRQGFDFCYDKNLYDKLRHNDVDGLKHCLWQSVDFQNRLTRFIENHDEDRAACVYPELNRHRCAALLAFTAAGMKFFHMGQLEGRVGRIPMQRRRYADTHGNNDSHWMGFHVEGVDCGNVPAGASDMYCRLLDLMKMPAVKFGDYIPAEVKASSNESQNHNAIVAFVRVAPSASGTSLLVVANYSDGWADGWVRFPVEVFNNVINFNADQDSTWMSELGGVRCGNLMMRDVIGSVDCYRKDVNEVKQRGVWFGLQPWQSHAFQLVWR